MALTTGTRLARYEIVSALGASGMGEVYCLGARGLSRDVALRVLPETRAGEPQFRERFEVEARAITSMAIIQGRPWLLSHRQEGHRHES